MTYDSLPQYTKIIAFAWQARPAGHNALRRHPPAPPAHHASETNHQDHSFATNEPHLNWFIGDTRMLFAPQLVHWRY